MQTFTLCAGQHGNYDKNRANNKEENWKKDITKLLTYITNTKSFCCQLYHMLTSYRFEDAFVDDFKQQIID